MQTLSCCQACSCANAWMVDLLQHASSPGDYLLHVVQSCVSAAAVGVKYQMLC